MQHCPGCFVAPQTQHALLTKGADAVLLAGHLPDGAKPDRQGKMAVLKNSSSRDRHLVAAMTAEPAGAPYCPSFGGCATRATPPRWPAQGRQILGAGLFAGKTPFQLKQRPGIILDHNPKHYCLGLVASSK